MKKILPLVLLLAVVLSFSGCGNQVKNKPPYEIMLPPMIDIYGQKYTAVDMPVKELPDGYTYLGELTKEEAYTTGLEGCKMFVVAELNSIPDFYLYQECGTPIDESTIDTTKKQWAYVKWIQITLPGADTE